jgi:hypothetical protein
MLIATCFGSKESSSGYSLNHIVGKSSTFWDPKKFTFKYTGKIHIENTTRRHSISKFCLPLSDSVQQLHVQQPSTHGKPEPTSAVLGS